MATLRRSALRTALSAVPMATIALSAGCDQAGGNAQPADAPAAASDSQAAPAGRATSSGPPHITFAATTHDFGAMYETEQRSASFEFTNTGGEVLVIKEIKTSCGCTAARLDKRQYRAGESGSIGVVFDPTGHGQQSKYLTVISNSEPEEVSRVTITADVKPFLIFDPPWLQMGVLPYAQEHRASVSVSSPDKDFVIEAARTTSEYATARVIAPAEAQSAGRTAAQAWTVEVVVSPEAPWGGCYFALEVVARGRPFPGADPVTHTSSIRVAGQLFGKLRAEPDMFRFGVDPGEAVEQTIRLSGVGGRRFEVLDVSVADPQLNGAVVRATEVAADAWDLTLTATAPPHPARCLGMVTVRTNVAGEDTIAIGILGVVREAPAGDG